MRKGIDVQMTTSLMITYLGVFPVFEQTKEDKQDAIDLCSKVLDISTNTDDESERVGMIAVVYLVSEIMELVEILDTLIIKEFIRPRNGRSIRLPPHEREFIREFVLLDHRGYIDWISPFLSKAGVDDIDSELRDLDDIQDAIQGLPQ